MDALKELSIRAIDGSDTTIEGFTLMGLNAEEMANKFAQGGDVSKEALKQTIEALKNMEDPIQQDLAGVDLFGTQWEDSSKQAILAMADIGDGLGDITGACEKAGEEINNSIGTKMETAMRRLKTSFAKVGEALLPVVEDLADGISDLADFIKKLDPELVTSVARFGAMAIAVGGVGKVVGGLTTTLGKGASALSKFLGWASGSKGALGTLASAGATAGGEKGLGSLIASLVKLHPAGAIVTAVVSALGIIGTAIYTSKKECEENGKKLQEMGTAYDDFTGKLEDDSTIWNEIFGKLIA